MTPHPDAPLLQSYLDGELSAEQVQALEARLKTDACLADQLLALAREEAVLREWARTERAADDTIRELLHPSHPRQRPGRPSVSRSWTVPFLALAITVLVAVGAFLLWYAGPAATSPAELAHLASVQGEVWLVTPLGQVTLAQDGARLFAGQEVRTGSDSSQAVIQYPDRSQLGLGSDTTVRLEAEAREAPGVGKRAFLQTGAVEAEVTPQPRGRPLILTTPHAVLRVAGTRFSSTALPEATWVELEEGQVELTRTSDGQSLVVKKDRFAVAAPRDEPLVALPLPPRVTEAQDIIPEQPGPVQSLVFAPDGQLLAIGSGEGKTIALWDRGRQQIVRQFRAHEQRVKALAFAPDGSLLASGGMDKFLRLWDPLTGAPQPISFPKQKRDIDVIAFTPDGEVLATALGYGKGAKGSEQIVLWTPRTGKELARIAGHTDLMLGLAIAPDGKTLAASFKDGTIKLWDLESRQERAAFRLHSGEVYALAFSPDGKLLATGGRDRIVRLWDAQTGEVRHMLGGHPREVRDLAFSPDGRLLASACSDSLVRIWDVASGTELRGLKGHRKGGVLRLAFSPDGTLLATGGADRRVLLWGVAGP